MEITQLHYFKTVAKYESFTRAAEDLHITQSALSRSIAQLEDDIGLQLFERRRGGRITLNQDGHFFLNHVIMILNTLENTVSAMKEAAGLERGIVTIAQSETVFVKHVIRDFLLSYPSVRLNCRLQSPEQIKSCLYDGTLNFAVCSEQISGADLIWEPLFHDHMTVLLPGSHPLADRERIYLAQLRQERFIIPNLGYGMNSQITDLCGLAGFVPHIVYEGLGDDLCGQLVTAGIGVMLAPFSISYGVRALGVERNPVIGIPIADGFAQNEVGLIRKQGQFQSAAAQELMERLRTFYTELSQL